MKYKRKYKSELDDFQKQAYEAVEKNHSVLVSAPTGTGKTVIAEHVMTKCLYEGKKVIYTAPIKALSNQKYREFTTSFPDKVGIITGDVSINPFAPLLIMTTEIFRNRVLERKNSLIDHSWIIFDEIHYLDDIDRGTVWEESLILMPPHIRFIGLSATIPNVDQFASWLKTIHSHPIEIIKTTIRPVPLHFYFQCSGKILNELKTVKKIGYSRRKNIYYQYNYNQHYRSPRSSINLKKETYNNSPISLIRHLIKANRLPCIYFSFSRKRCEYLAKKALSLSLISIEEQNNAQMAYDRACDELNISESERKLELRELVSKGIAYHHAGIHPMLKEVIEQLFYAKYIKIIFTTETFALGINMPAKSVVIDEMRKNYGRFHKMLKIRDFHQMAGRSGRRGIDKEGFVYCRINPEELSFRQISHILSASSEPIRSRFNASYATILNLYETYEENFLNIFSLSFYHFLEKKQPNSYQLNQMKSKLKTLKQLDYIRDKKLTIKGHLAKKLYGYELILAELYKSGIFEKLSAKELGILCLAVVFEPKPRLKKAKLSYELKRVKAETDKIIKHIRNVEKTYRIDSMSKRPFFDLSFSLIDWMKNKSFDNVIEETDLDEGEIIRYYRMSIQILREMLDTPVPTELKEKISKTINLINYGAIDAENQLQSTANIEL